MTINEIAWTVGAFATVFVAPMVFFSVLGIAALMAKWRTKHMDEARGH